MNACWTRIDADLSVENRELVCVTNLPTGQSRINTLIIGVFHGDEREAGQLAETLLEKVLPEMLSSQPIAVIPCLNPDGWERNQRVNAHGVDLNRNFPTENWEPGETGTIYYAGNAQASEPETQFLMRMISTLNPQKIITLHTPYKVINFDGPALEIANAMSAENGYPVVDDIGYATPGSFGTYYGKERQIPVITLELPEENFDNAECLRNLNALYAAIRY